MMYVVLGKEGFEQGESVEIKVNDVFLAERMAGSIASTFLGCVLDVYELNEDGVLGNHIVTVKGEPKPQKDKDVDDYIDEPYDPYDEVGYDPYTGGYDIDL